MRLLLLCLSPMMFLLQKPVDDLSLRFLLRKPQCHQLDDLLSRDLADGRLVDQGCVRVVGRDPGYGAYPGIVHDNGVALRMACAFGVAVDLRVKDLGGILLGNRPGDSLFFFAKLESFSYIISGIVLTVTQLVKITAIKIELSVVGIKFKACSYIGRCFV